MKWRSFERNFPRVVIALVLGFLALHVWNRYENCVGSSRFHVDRAKQHRLDAEKPETSAGDKQKYLAAAEVDDFASRRWVSLAWQPWRSFPAPFVSSQEIAEIEQRYAAKSGKRGN